MLHMYNLIGAIGLGRGVQGLGSRFWGLGCEV